MTLRRRGLTARTLASSWLVSSSVVALGGLYACGGKVDNLPPAVEVGTLPQLPSDAGTRLDADVVKPQRPALPPTTKAPEIDLGEVPSGTTVTLAVPPNALGFNVVVEGAPTATVGVRTITSPSGEVVLAEHKVIGGSFETSLGEEGVAAASVPQSRLTSAAPIEPGVWSIAVSGPPGATLSVKARIQISGDGTFRGGAADMHVYLPKGLRVEDPQASHVVSAQNAETDKSVEARLASFYEGLEANFGIQRGDVFFHDVDSSFVNISTESALSRAFAASKGQIDGTQTLHVLFTNALDFGDGTWGIAPGIPGASTRTGTVMSGVTLALTPDTPADLDGLALLHEVGHFIGLAHSTEFDGESKDPLADTPTCVGILDLQKPETIDRCPDKNNLMFPTLWGSGVEVSDSQKIVFRGSPSYKAFVGTTATPPPTEPVDAGVSDASLLPDPGGQGLPEKAAKQAARKLSLTKSGRALTPTERFVLGGLCGHTKLDFTRFSGHLGVPAAKVELARIAGDLDLPGVLRMRASKMLAHAK